MIRKTLTLPAKSDDKALQSIADAISGWHIVFKVERTKNVIVWTQTVGYGSGAESLGAYLEGMFAAVRLLGHKGVIDVKTEFLEDK
jgi:hypothetical protein